MLIVMASLLLISGLFIAPVSGEEPIKIRDIHDLQNISEDLESDYILISDINASGYQGFEPIGACNYEITKGCTSQPFNGTLDGNNHSITGLTINKPNKTEVGIFTGIGRNSVIKNLEINNITIKGKNYVGGVIGANTGNITNTKLKGTITGTASVGGLAGENNGDIYHSSTQIEIYGESPIGGITGGSLHGNIHNTTTKGKIHGDYMMGGLIGRSEYSNITDSSADVTVQISTQAKNDETTYSFAHGGFAGSTYHSNISNSYATGDVEGGNGVGGFTGTYNGERITDSYATGDVEGKSMVGGFVGGMIGDIDRSYSTGNVTGEDQVGGFIGEIVSGNVTNSYTTSNVTGKNDTGGLIGRLGRPIDPSDDNITLINLTWKNPNPNQPILGNITKPRNKTNIQNITPPIGKENQGPPLDLPGFTSLITLITLIIITTYHTYKNK